ncbi:MAG: histidine--tRNA ligase [Proteobacteria bacterium]|nr:histidine--tRNA ligase [Pseudomonadota bacterium]
MDRIQAVRGMNDILPHETPYWQFLEKQFAELMQQYGVQEIRFPLVESTQLFKRSIGEVTDIVEKEMYTFNDLNGDSLTLRPEGTAGCLRACLEHGLLHNQQQKLWYKGAMFRHEKPQKGRYRQFYQFGVEVFGIEGYAIELELISLCYRLWKRLGIQKEVHLEINTLGELEERQAYRETLVAYFKAHFDKLDEDSKRRLERNPLRILDSKTPEMQNLINNAPKLLDSLGEKSRGLFDNLCKGLEHLKIPYQFNPRLVRGLDYYGHTVFEWVTDKLGSQATVCAGGRFDALVEQLGGRASKAIGFAMGAERLLLLLETLNCQKKEEKHSDVFIMPGSEGAIFKAIDFAEKLRDKNPEWQIITNTQGGSFKNQFKKADKSGAKLALIFGEEELQQGKIGLKNLRSESQQISLHEDEMMDYLQQFLSA